MPQDVKQARGGTPVALLILGLNVATFLLAGGLTGTPGPLFVLSMENFLANPFALIGAGFMHAGVIHLAVNMFALFALGDAERALGSGRFLLLYLAALLGGGLGVLLLSTSPTVGASGAIYGLLGFALVSKLYAHARKSLLVLVGINLAISFIIPGISWQGHLGGFVAGVAFALLHNRTLGREEAPSVGLLLPKQEER